MELLQEKRPSVPLFKMESELSVLVSSSDSEENIEEEINTPDDTLASPYQHNDNTPCYFSKNLSLAESDNFMNTITNRPKLQRDDFTPSPINSSRRREIRKALMFTSPELDYTSLTETDYCNNSFGFSSPEYEHDLIPIFPIETTNTSTQEVPDSQLCTTIYERDSLLDLLMQLDDTDVWTNSDRQYKTDHTPVLDTIDEEITPPVTSLENNFYSTYLLEDDETINMTF